MKECGPCPVFASFTPAFALQLRKKHGKTSVRLRKTSVRVHKTSESVLDTYHFFDWCSVVCLYLCFWVCLCLWRDVGNGPHAKSQSQLKTLRKTVRFISTIIVWNVFLFSVTHHSFFSHPCISVQVLSVWTKKQDGRVLDVNIISGTAFRFIRRLFGK